MCGTAFWGYHPRHPTSLLLLWRWNPVCSGPDSCCSDCPNDAMGQWWIRTGTKKVTAQVLKPLSVRSRCSKKFLGIRQHSLGAPWGEESFREFGAQGGERSLCGFGAPWGEGSFCGFGAARERGVSAGLMHHGKRGVFCRFGAPRGKRSFWGFGMTGKLFAGRRTTGRKEFLRGCCTMPERRVSASSVHQAEGGFSVGLVHQGETGVSAGLVHQGRGELMQVWCTRGKGGILWVWYTKAERSFCGFGIRGTRFLRVGAPRGEGSF